MCGHVQHGLKHQGGFAYPRFTTEQYHGTGDNPLAQHAVQFDITCWGAPQFEDFDICQRLGFDRLQCRALPPFTWGVRANRKGF